MFHFLFSLKSIEIFARGLWSALTYFCLIFVTKNFEIEGKPVVFRSQTVKRRDINQKLTDYFIDYRSRILMVNRMTKIFINFYII